MIKMEKWDRFYLEMAQLVSTRSKDPSTKFGSVLVRPPNIVVSVGYNGFPAKMEDNPEWLENREVKYSRIIHGEMNALHFARQDVRGCTMYGYPFIPCDRCAVQLIQAGISRSVSFKPTEDQNSRWGVSFAKTRQYFAECGVEVVEL